MGSSLDTLMDQVPKPDADHLLPIRVLRSKPAGDPLQAFLKAAWFACLRAVSLRSKGTLPWSRRPTLAVKGILLFRVFTKQLVQLLVSQLR